MDDKIHDIAEILQKVALSTKNQSMKSIKFLKVSSLLGLLINQCQHGQV
jgi:hypothetical protein